MRRAMRRTQFSQGAALIVAALVHFGLLAGSAARAADWADWRGPSRNGVTSEEVLTAWPAAGPRRLWSAEIGTSYASVAVEGGRVYAIGTRAGQETVYGLDARTGAVLWRFARPHPKRDTQ